MTTLKKKKKARGRKPVRGERKQDKKNVDFVATKFNYYTPYLCVSV